MTRQARRQDGEVKADKVAALSPQAAAAPSAAGSWAMQIASQVGLPEWVQVDDKEMKGVFKQVPARDEILPDIIENLVVELYSK